MVALIFGDFSEIVHTNRLPDIQLFSPILWAVLLLRTVFFFPAVSFITPCHHPKVPGVLSRSPWPGLCLDVFSQHFSLTVLSFRSYVKIFDLLYRFLCG